MPGKKKTKKQQKTKSKKTSGKNRMKAAASAKKKPEVKGKATKRLAQNKSSKKKVRAKIKPGGRKVIGTDTRAFPRVGREALSGGQSGDLQGLSSVEGPDSESVSELLEEGNAFEADVVAGVEHARDAATREVHTHEVPEDDVPEEYLDKD